MSLRRWTFTNMMWSGCSDIGQGHVDVDGSGLAAGCMCDTTFLVSGVACSDVCGAVSFAERTGDVCDQMTLGQASTLASAIEAFPNAVALERVVVL